MGSCVSVRDDREPEEHWQGGTPTETDDNSAVIAVEECRICFDKQISAKDPVVQLGCKCLGDLSCAHQSCIRKWFPTKSVNSGTIACEICMAKLGQEARSIVKIEIRSKVFQYFFQRGLAKITHTIGRIIITLSNGVQSLNDAIEELGPLGVLTLNTWSR